MIQVKACEVTSNGCLTPHLIYLGRGNLFAIWFGRLNHFKDGQVTWGRLSRSTPSRGLPCCAFAKFELVPVFMLFSRIPPSPLIESAEARGTVQKRIEILMVLTINTNGIRKLKKKFSSVRKSCVLMRDRIYMTKGALLLRMQIIFLDKKKVLPV